MNGNAIWFREIETLLRFRRFRPWGRVTSVDGQYTVGFALLEMPGIAIGVSNL